MIFGYTYIAFVGNLDDNYRLDINGNKYKFENINKTIFTIKYTEEDFIS